MTNQKNRFEELKPGKFVKIKALGEYLPLPSNGKKKVYTAVGIVEGVYRNISLCDLERNSNTTKDISYSKALVIIKCADDAISYPIRLEDILAVDELVPAKEFIFQ
ncbi:MAG: hypothetical protein U9Q69_06290 [Nanoarchaeota archaeon]|nr:hypothetical protein [Nanoarchaeota archaeon]